MPGIRAGFFLGFLGGALLSSQQGHEGPQERAEGGPTAADLSQPSGPLQKLKQRLREALAAGRDAAHEKERELREEFERRTKPQE